MHTRSYLTVAATCLLCAGCELATNLACNTAYEIGRCTNEKLEMLRNCRLAREAWNEEKSACPGEARSEDYGEGFRAGYADYLFAGGPGEPPPFAPPRYWCLRNESPEGYGRMQEWFAGFRHGAAAAKASGLRNLVVLPMSGPAPAGPPPVPYVTVPTPAVIAPGTEILPPPKRVPAAGQLPAPDPAPALLAPRKEEGPQPLPPVPAAPRAPQARQRTGEAIPVAARSFRAAAPTPAPCAWRLPEAVPVAAQSPPAASEVPGDFILVEDAEVAVPRPEEGAPRAGPPPPAPPDATADFIPVAEAPPAAVPGPGRPGDAEGTAVRNGPGVGVLER